MRILLVQALAHSKQADKEKAGAALQQFELSVHRREPANPSRIAILYDVGEEALIEAAAVNHNAVTNLFEA